jgi:D-glycero-D-manno-heptose 1,7-bisphosphate phosphatase
MRRKATALFVDRDGTVIVDRGYPKDPRDVTLVPGAAQGLRALRAAGHKIVVISNQSGVGRGMLTEDDVARVHARMVAILTENDVAIDGAYYCMHAPDVGCLCRKPRPGLVMEAARELDLDVENSVMVGDKISDVETGLAAGCARAILLAARAPDVAPCHYVAATWDDIVRIVTKG